MSFAGILSFATGGALFVVAIGFVVSYALHATIGGRFFYGAFFGFLAFLLMGLGEYLILQSLNSDKQASTR